MKKLKFLFVLLFCFTNYAMLSAQPKKVDVEVEWSTVTITKEHEVPFFLHAKMEGDIYFWQAPAGVSFEDRGNTIIVTKAPAGEHTFNVKIIQVDWDKRKLTQDFGNVTVLVGSPEPLKVTFMADCATITEGGVCTITAKTNKPVEQTTIFYFDQTGSADKDDYTASHRIEVAKGLNTGTMSIMVWEDNVAETDEQLCFKVKKSEDFEVVGPDEICFAILDKILPDPDFNPGKYNLEEFAYQKAKNLVSNPALNKTAKPMADSYKGIASAVRAGAYKDIQSAVDALRAKTSQLEPSAWKNFHAEIRDYTYEFHKQKKLNNLSDFALAWEEIGNGLELLAERLQ